MDSFDNIALAEDSIPAQDQAAEEIFPPTDRTQNSDYTAASGVIIEEDLSSGVGSENRMNGARLSNYKLQFSGKFLELIQESELEFGYDSTVDAFLRERLAENALATKEWINSLFIENFADVGIATAILRVIGHLKYHEIAPQGPTIALAALSHVSLEVRECGVRAFENWGTLDCLRILTNLSCAEGWMKEYVTQVVSDLQESLLHVSSGQKD